MKDYDLIHEWLDFISSQKMNSQANKKHLNEIGALGTVASFGNSESASDTSAVSGAIDSKKVSNELVSSPRGSNKIEGIVIHHTATNDPKITLAVLKERGFSTNYEVDQKGNIYEYLDPDKFIAIASNTANNNTLAIDVTTGDGSWPPAQKQALTNLVKKLADKYKFKISIAPDKVTKNWSDWKKEGKYTLFRHRNFHATECPSSLPLESIFGSALAENINKRKILKEQLDKKLFRIKDETNNNLYKKYQKYFDSLTEHLKKELKINKPVKIVLEDDEENGKKVLGRTGGYINHEIKIHIFCSGRHIKDIMRSLAHEMVHHHQNLRGEFKHHEPTTNGYAQSNKHLRKMEEEAYLKGNILFRDWEDNYKYRGEK